MEEKKKSKGLIVTLIIIIVVLLGVIGYFVYDKYLTDNEVVNKETDNEELALSDTRVVDIEKKIANIGSFCNRGGKYFYQKNIYNSQMNKYDKIDSVINYLDLKSLEDTELFTINDFSGFELSNESIKEVEQTYKNLFGQDQEFVPGDKSSTYSSIIKVDGKYYLALMGCGSEYTVLDLTQKAIKDGEEIKIYKKVGYLQTVVSMENSILNSALSTDLKGKNIIAQLDKYDVNFDETEYYTEQMNKNIDQFDSYVITFKLDSTGNYYFYSSELVK